MPQPKLFMVAAATAGVCTHLFIFKHGEWHMQAPTILRAYVGLTGIFLALEVLLEGLAAGLGVGIACIATYSMFLFASIGVYRVAFHQLRKFPGPFLAASSKFWHVLECVRSNSQNHLVLDDLHKRYGDFVRTGPNEITVFHPDIFQATDGPGNTCTKAVWYDFLLPEVAINTTRDKVKHDKRRKIWDRGFTSRALSQYQQTIAEYTMRIDQHLEQAAFNRDPVDISSWVYWYSFDIMGEFAFARSFDMLRDKKWHHAILMLRRAMGLLGPLSPVPWLAQIGFHLIPNLWVVKDWYSMMNWCKVRMSERIEMIPERPDVSMHIIEASKEKGTIEVDRHWLNGDAIAIIIAGSDTVAPTLVFLLYELAKNPAQAEKLHTELSQIDTTDHKVLQDLAHLNGVINEVLRIHPPVPSGGYRQTPKCGITVGGRYIPGGTTIVAPRYTIGRLESCFERPDDFIPERWYKLSDMVKNKKAFAPFSQGRYSCVGKNLAMAELRYLTALFVSKYTFNFLPGEDGREVEGAMKDQFTAAPGQLKLMFKSRAVH